MCSPPDAGDGLMELLAHCAPPVDGGVGDVLDESERWAGTLHVLGALGRWLRLMKCVPSTNKISAAVRNRVIKVATASTPKLSGATAELEGHRSLHGLRQGHKFTRNAGEKLTQ